MLRAQTHSSPETQPERAKAPSKHEKVRLSLEVSLEMNRTLDALADQSGTTKSDVLRRAIALMEVALEARAQGHKVAVLDAADKPVTRIVGL